MNFLRKVLLSILFVAISTHLTSAQQDSSYYVSYPSLLTGRFYFSQKFTSLNFQNTKEHYALDYKPNTNLNMGLGATYKWATLNLAYGFGFMNPDGNKGKTHYLDLQFHGYNKKFNLDVLAQFYRGFYVSQGGTVTLDHYYIRPDLRANIVGGSFQYIFNYRRFSLRASYLQTDWQKRSAGSPLIGFETYTGRVRADSTFTPTYVNREVAKLNETKMSFVVLGPNVGYAYTFVVQEHFFVTGSASVSLDYGVNTLTSMNGKANSGALSSNIFSRLMAGYNSERWALSIIYINNEVHLGGTNSNRVLVLNTGNVRVCFVHRFVLGSAERELLKVIK